MFAQRNRLIVGIACVVCAGLLFLYHPLRAQQPSENPFVMVKVRDFNTSSNYLIQLSGEGKQIGDRIPLDASDQDILVSGNGQWIAIHESNPQKQEQSLKYRPMGASTTNLVRLDTNTYSVFSAFSRDSRYLLYGTATGSNQPSVGIVGIVELSSGIRAEYTGEIAYGNNAKSPFRGIPWPLEFDGKRLWFMASDPDRVPVALSSIDLPGFQAGSHGALSGPVKSWHKLSYELGAAQLSPDGNRLLYLFNNPANPPANYNPSGVDRTVNSLGVIDLSTGTDTVIAQAGAGQALGVAAWSDAGDHIVFSSGSFQNSDHLISPGLYSVDVHTGQVNTILSSLVPKNPQEMVVNMLVCSRGLFYISYVGNTGALYIAPLNDLHAGKMLLSGTNIGLSLVGCGYFS